MKKIGKKAPTSLPDTYLQLTTRKNSAIIRNGETFRLACCDCHLVHGVIIISPQLPSGLPLTITLRRDRRATNSRRKLKLESPKS